MKYLMILDDKETFIKNYMIDGVNDAEAIAKAKIFVSLQTFDVKLYKESLTINNQVKVVELYHAELN